MRGNDSCGKGLNLSETLENKIEDFTVPIKPTQIINK
jgi:hypothetical protein